MAENKKDAEKIKVFDDGIKTFKEFKTSVQVLSLLGIIMGTLLTLIVTSFCIFGVILVDRNDLKDIPNDEGSVAIVSKINYYDYDQARNALLSYDSKTKLIIFELALPSFAIIMALIGITISSRYLYSSIKTATSNKNLFTVGRLEQLKRIRNVLTVSLLPLWFILSIVFLYLWIVVEIFMEIIIYIYEYAVSKNIGTKIKE